MFLFVVACCPAFYLVMFVCLLVLFPRQRKLLVSHVHQRFVCQGLENQPGYPRMPGMFEVPGAILAGPVVQPGCLNICCLESAAGGKFVV